MFEILTLERFVLTFSNWRFKIIYVKGIVSTLFYPTAQMVTCDV